MITLKPQKCFFFFLSGGYAGEYEVWYQGARRGTNMVINCDNSVTQPNIFTDALHFDNVASHCNHDGRNAGSTIYILKTHGANKHECLQPSSNGVLKGHHYMCPNGCYYGTIEYRPITKKSCGNNTFTVLTQQN